MKGQVSPPPPPYAWSILYRTYSRCGRKSVPCPFRAGTSFWNLASPVFLAIPLLSTPFQSIVMKCWHGPDHGRTCLLKHRHPSCTLVHLSVLPSSPGSSVGSRKCSSAHCRIFGLTSLEGPQSVGTVWRDTQGCP